MKSEHSFHYQQTPTCKNTKWIQSTLLEEYKLFSKRTCQPQLPSEFDIIHVIFENQPISVTEIINVTFKHKDLLYNRAIRQINHGWIQFCHLNAVHVETFQNLISYHDQALKHINLLIDICRIDIELPSSIKSLQDDYSIHKEAILAIKDKITPKHIQLDQFMLDSIDKLTSGIIRETNEYRLNDA